MAQKLGPSIAARLYASGGAALVGVLGTALYFALSTPVFLSTANLLNIGRQTAIVALVSIGMTFVIITGGIDLSVGSVVGLSGTLAAVAIAQAHTGPFLGALIGLATGTSIGIINGAFIAILRVPAIVATLALLSIAQGDRSAGDERAADIRSDVFVFVLRPGRDLWSAGGLYYNGLLLCSWDPSIARDGGRKTHRGHWGERGGRQIGRVESPDLPALYLCRDRISLRLCRIGPDVPPWIWTTDSGGRARTQRDRGRCFGWDSHYWRTGNSHRKFSGRPADNYPRKWIRLTERGQFLSIDLCRSCSPRGGGNFEAYGALVNDLLKAENISKSYGGVRAVEEVSLQVAAGEVVAVVGDNGAGKSTFTKILAGAVRPDSGSLSFQRRAVAFHSPKDAQRLGIEMLQQDLALVGDFNAAENLFFGRELSMLGILRGKKMTDQTREVLQQLGVSLPDSKVPVRYLSGGQRQAVAIGRVLAWGSKVIILDEPTAALGVQETRQVLEMIKRMKADGRTIVLITHNMDHVLEVADRVIVMRRGKKVGDLAVGHLQIADIVHLIVAG